MATTTSSLPSESGFTRPQLRYRPVKAWRHFRKLVQDKENTREVFHIFEALPWKGMPEAAQAFTSSERGRAILASEPRLSEILDDHATLRRLPAGSVAQAYCDFMEAEGLTAQGLVEEYEQFTSDRPEFGGDLAFYIDRLRDTHDLLHVIAGYGRDALGEQCVLAFTYSQQPAPAYLFIAYAGGFEMRRAVKSAAPVFRAIREAQMTGKACPLLAELPVRELLAMPLDMARIRLNVSPPRFYAEAHRTWRAMGLDPLALLRKQDA